jgi:predicted N-acetyltransferase YhbS
MPIDDITIRPATAGDAATLAATIVAAFEQYRGRLVPDSGAHSETAASIAAEFHKGAGGFIAERCGAIIGCVMTKDVGGDLYLGRLSVLPAARGQDIGRRLISTVEAEARRRGLPATRLAVRIALPENQRLFAALGYAETNREAHPGFAEATFINMRKRLAG